MKRVIVWCGVMVSICLSVAAAQELPPATQAAPAATPNDVLPIFKKYKSILFSEQEIMHLNAIEQKQKDRLSAGTTAASPADKAGKVARTVYYTYPQFYLASLAYRAPGQWIFWMNGVKYTPASGPIAQGATIESVLPSQVVFTYRLSGTDYIRTDNVPANPHVEIRAQERTIRFTLLPNQTFSTYTLRIYEGQVAPVTIAINNAAARTTPEPEIGETIGDVFSAPVDAAAPEPLPTH